MPGPVSKRNICTNLSTPGAMSWSGAIPVRTLPPPWASVFSLTKLHAGGLISQNVEIMITVAARVPCSYFSPRYLLNSISLD